MVNDGNGFSQLFPPPSGMSNPKQQLSAIGATGLRRWTSVSPPHDRQRRSAVAELDMGVFPFCVAAAVTRSGKRDAAAVGIGVSSSPVLCTRSSNESKLSSPTHCWFDDGVSAAVFGATFPSLFSGGSGQRR
nr:hypothetical protein Iba_chr13eCG10670 [Ipomoea batatas]